MDAIGLFTLGLVHQLIRALNEFGGQMAGDEAAVRQATEPETHHANIDPRRCRVVPNSRVIHTMGTHAAVIKRSVSLIGRETVDRVVQVG